MTFLATWLLGFGLPKWAVKILEPLAILLAVALIAWGVIHELRASGAREQKAKDAAQITALQAALSQSTANVATMKGAVDQCRADSLARAQAYNDAAVENAKDVAAANARWEASEKSRAKLADLAAHGMSGCKASTELLNAIEGGL